MSKNKILFLFIISSFFFILSTGCTRKADSNSVIHLKLPSEGFSKISEFKYSEPMSMQNVSTYGDDDDGAEWNPALNPSSMIQVNCYLIMVSGPESDMQRNVCSTTTGQNLKVGRWAGGIPAGSILSLEVPAGAKREITVVGFKATNGACTNFKTTDVNGMSLSEPHILGKVTKDLTPGKVEVSVPVPSYTIPSTTLKISDCKGPDFNMEKSQLYFGDSPSGAGTYTLSMNKSYSSIGDPVYNLGGESRRIIAFDTSPAAVGYEGYTFLEFNSPVTNLSVGSEVMIVNQAMNGNFIMSLGSNQAVTNCGYRVWDGVYGFARVMAVSSTPHGIYVSKGSFVDKLDWNPSTQAFDPALASQITTNLGANPAESNSDFCRLKAVKVLHYYDMTIGAGYKITPDPFDFDGDGAGILPIRVANTLEIQDGGIINATNMGYAPVDGKDGSSSRGVSSSGTCDSSSDTSFGGACSGSNYGSGGGGHGSASTLMSTMSGGSNFTGLIPGGYALGEDCGDGSCFGSLSHKMFLGAAGGSTAGLINATSHRGGGIIYLMAKNIVVPDTMVGIIAADGGSGQVTDSPSYGGSGGHAGGSVMMGYKELSVGLGGMLSINAGGGSGGSSSVASEGGGGGGAGRMHFTKCTSSSASTGVYKYVNGGGGGTSFGSNPGLPGFAGSIYEKTVPCE